MAFELVTAELVSVWSVLVAETSAVGGCSSRLVSAVAVGEARPVGSTKSVVVVRNGVNGGGGGRRPPVDGLLDAVAFEGDCGLRAAARPKPSKRSSKLRLCRQETRS